MPSRPCPQLVRAADIAAAETEFHHPWNPASHLIGAHLSRLGGLARTGLSLARIPPGRESFAYHSHHCEEEWIYILSGRAIADIGEASYEVGPGDFMAFPTPSVAHHLRNPFETELVYLMGGENRPVEIAEFPRLGRRTVRIRDKVETFPMERPSADAAAPRRRR